MEAICHFFADDRGKFLGRSFGDGAKGSKIVEELFDGGWTDPLLFEEGDAGIVAPFFVPVERDREAVGFVAEALAPLEAGVGGLEGEGAGFGVEEVACSAFGAVGFGVEFLLGDGDDVKGDAGIVQEGEGESAQCLSTVYEPQVGGWGFGKPGDAPGEHFVHLSVFVPRLEGVAAVAPLVPSAVIPHHHGADGRFSHHVGVVKYFDPHGRGVEAEEGGDLLFDCFGGRLRAQQLGGIGAGDLGETFSGTALGGKEADGACNSLGEGGGDLLGFFEGIGYEDCTGYRRHISGVKVQQCLFVGRGEIEEFGEGEKAVCAGDDPSVPEEHPHHHAPFVPRLDRENIEVVGGRQIDVGVDPQPVDLLDLVAESGRLFEPFLLCQFEHPLFEAPDQTGAFEDRFGGLIDDGAVRLGGDFPFARGGAFADLVKQARFAPIQTALFLHEGEHFVEGVEQRPSSGGERAEVADSSAPDDPAGEFETGEGLGAVYIDIGVGFVVAQEDIVAGFELFDEAVFEDQGVGFGGGEQVVEAHRFVEHFGDPGAEGRVGAKLRGEAPVAFDPVCEALGFADVEETAVAVEILVDAGLIGEGADGLLDGRMGWRGGGLTHRGSGWHGSVGVPARTGHGDRDRCCDLRRFLRRVRSSGGHSEGTPLRRGGR